MKSVIWFLFTDLDGQGQQWRMAFAGSDSYWFPDVDFSAPVEVFEKDRRLGPFSVDQLVRLADPK